jgi:hypothetical protein
MAKDPMNKVLKKCSIAFIDFEGNYLPGGQDLSLIDCTIELLFMGDEPRTFKWNSQTQFWDEISPRSTKCTDTCRRTRRKPSEH